MLRLLICGDCLGESGLAGLAALSSAVATSDLSGKVIVERRSCGDRCTAPAQMWLQAPGGASYVFEGIDLARDRNDVLATLRAYLAAPGGWIEDARPCGRLRFCLKVRLPA